MRSSQKYGWVLVVIQGSPHPTMSTETFQLHEVLEEKITFSFVGFT